MRSRVLSILVVGVVILGACADPGSRNLDEEAAKSTTAAQQEDEKVGDSPPESEDTTSTTQESGPSDSPETEPPEELTSTTRPSKEPERVPEDTTPPPVAGETPPTLMAQIIVDATDRAGVDSSQVTVIRDESVLWADGSLGCPKPGEVYTHGSVNGYWVVVEADGAEYDYRVNANGYFFFCESPSPGGGVPTG